jgi:uncharacterized membrane protein (UPF0127 family)
MKAPGPYDFATTSLPDLRLQVFNATRGTLLANSLEVADTGTQAQQGIAWPKELAPGEGLWIVPCESVHTFFMKFPIDLVYIDRKNRIKKVVRNVVPHGALRMPLRAFDSRAACGHN